MKITSGISTNSEEFIDRQQDSRGLNNQAIQKVPSLDNNSPQAYRNEDLTTITPHCLSRVGGEQPYRKFVQAIIKRFVFPVISGLSLRLLI